MLKVKVILGSIREGRFGDKPAQFYCELAKENKDWDVELIDLRDWELPLKLPEQLPGTVMDGNYGDEKVNAWGKKIAEGDAFIIIASEYNNGYAASLKNAIDHVYHEWRRKPVCFVSYGGISGGIRSVQQLRQVVIELHMAPLRHGVYLPFGRSLWNDDGTPKDPEDLKKRATDMLNDLDWWGNTLKRGREQA